MYGFQNEDFLKTLNGAVAQIGEINRIADKVSDLGYKNIYLVGTGGTYAIISPLAYMLKTNSALVWYHEIAAELLAAKPRSLTKDSLFITASLSGTTKETIAAAEYARSMGATVISFVGDRTAPLAAVSDYVVENAACNDNLVEELHIQFFALGARLMMKNGEFPQYERSRTTNEHLLLQKSIRIQAFICVWEPAIPGGRHIALPCACWRKCSGFLPNPFMRQNFSTALWR